MKLSADVTEDIKVSEEKDGSVVVTIPPETMGKIRALLTTAQPVHVEFYLWED